jgi:hypothetical protein
MEIEHAKSALGIKTKASSGITMHIPSVTMYAFSSKKSFELGNWEDKSISVCCSRIF